MEPLIHLILPPLTLLALYPKINKKLLITLIPFTFLMDFDLFIPCPHRFLFHNLLFVIISTILILILINKKAALITAYYTIAHLILDLQKPGVAFLYPFIKKSFYISTKIIDSPFNWQFNWGTMSLDQYLKESITYHSHYLTTAGTQLILIIFISLLLITAIKKLKNHNAPN